MFGSLVRRYSRLGFAAVVLATALFFGGKASAAILTFESPDYSVAPLAGQQGWEIGEGTATMGIAATTTSGLYQGGQALQATGGANFNQAKQAGLGQSFYDATTKSITADFFVGGTYTATTRNYEMRVFGWYDGSETPSYADTTSANNVKNQIAFGTFRGEFSLREAEHDARISGDPIPLQEGNWYRITATLDYANLQVTLTAINLTTGGTPVDTGFTNYQLTAAQFGVDPATYSGIGVRLDREAGYIDNISTIPIPEPAACLLLALAGVGLLLARRSRRR